MVTRQYLILKSKSLDMQVIQKFFLFVALAFSFSALHAQMDSVMYQRDSVIIPETDATVLFFQQNEKAKSTASVQVITKANKTVSLATFLAGTGIYADHVFADLDKDGKKELLISNYTGGAHCCDEIYIFKNIAPGKYQYAVRFFAGNTIIMKDNEFVYNFYEQFGYFFTCYACVYTDTSDAAPVDLHDILLKYVKGKMIIAPGDKELRSTINDNLGKLGELPYEKLENDLTQDNGLRKAFAINLAVFYYSFGRNLIETQKLFNKYYKYPDAKKVWAAFVKQLQTIKKDNDF
jgi:hypothetical protein